MLATRRQYYCSSGMVKVAVSKSVAFHQHTRESWHNLLNLYDAWNNPEKADVFIDNICLFKSGKPLPFDKKLAAEKLDCDEVSLRMEFHLGDASATAWGCDLSEEYVVINSEYTT